MRKNKIIILVFIIAIVFLISVISITGLDLGNRYIPKISDTIDLGLDLAGGVYVILEADTDLRGSELYRAMEQTRVIITQRVDGLGVADPNIVIEGDNRIRIELAGIENPDEAIEMIGKTAQLQFIDPDGNIIVSGSNVKESSVVFEPTNVGDQPVVALEFDEEGTINFANTTERLVKETEIDKKIISIQLDGEIISEPFVSAHITDGNAVISGGFDIEEAGRLANLIRAGALPVEMVELQTSIIGPTLGLQALEKSILAGAIAVALIFAFMIVVYRLSGIVASIALTIYILLDLIIIGLFGVKLTLPGILGLVLSTGMAVDANVIIFERIKEELRLGKTLRTAIDHGYNRALSSVLDSNITTLIAGIALYYFGIGPIKGFGVTLIIGIIVSMFTSVIISKYLLKLMSEATNARDPKYYGV